MLTVILYLLAVILLTLAAFGVSARRVQFGWLGLAIALFTFAVLPQLSWT